MALVAGLPRGEVVLLGHRGKDSTAAVWALRRGVGLAVELAAVERAGRATLPVATGRLSLG